MDEVLVWMKRQKKNEKLVERLEHNELKYENIVYYIIKKRL